MQLALSRSAVVVAFAMVAACEGAVPPPPVLSVTSPSRGLVQNGGRVMVQGIASPGTDGYAIAGVTVNGVKATLAADGSFAALVDVEPGASMLSTTATTDNGGAATDVRSVHVGEVRPVGSTIERAITATLSAPTFARLSTAGSDYLKTLDLPTLLAPIQPMATYGGGNARVKVSLTNLSLGDVKITLTPVNGALMFSAELDDLNVGALADYDGTFVIDGRTSVTMTAATVVLSGELAFSPSASGGFAVAVKTPTLRTTALRLDASGIVGTIADLLQDNLSSTISKVAQKAAESGLEPILNKALAKLDGPKRFDVLGHQLELQASPQAIEFTTDGALVTVNLALGLAGASAVPQYVYVPSGEPTLDVSDGLQVAVSDNMMNSMIAQVHAMGLLDMHIPADLGVFDMIDVHLETPPMISANTPDGSLRILLGDAKATIMDHGNPIISGHLNAQVDVSVAAGATADEIAIAIGEAELFLNLEAPKADQDGTVGLDDSDEAGGLTDLILPLAQQGIKLKFKALGDYLVKVPTPTIAGVTLDSFQMHTDHGYVVVGAQLH